MEPRTTSHIELSKSAYRSNLKFLRQFIGPAPRYSAVVKGNAYGHGIEHLVPLGESLGVDHFSVFDAHEASRVFQVKKPQTEVMIMGMIRPDEIEWAIRNDVSFYIFDFDRLEAALETARLLQRPARVHIEVETGMNRTGFPPEALHELAETLNTYAEHLIFEGLCTHYAGAESVTNYLRVQQQIARFEEISAFFIARNLRPRYRHTACSAAALVYPQTRMDLVRIGIAQYGFWPSREVFIHYLTKVQAERGVDKVIDPLKRIIAWKSRVMHLKSVKRGEFIGYGTAYLATKNMRAAVIPVGYAYGYSRALSNQGRVLIRGRSAEVIGTVNMNQVIVNIDNIPQVQPGDDVVLIGRQNKLAITVASFGESSRQLNYELLTRLPSNIPRTIVD